MSQVTTSSAARPVRPRKSKGPSKADLQQRLLEALSRAERAEAALLAKPATATPPPAGLAVEALQPAAEGVLRVWLMTASEGYRLKLVHLGADGVGWEMVKWSNGTRYHLFEADGGTITCDCPGGAAHGPHWNDGKGCKHARMLRAVRQLVDPGI